MVVRIQKAQICNFRNVKNGEIRFPCNQEEDIFTPNADVIGLYGQNGSGKTTFIHALNILKELLSGRTVKSNLAECISLGCENAKLTFEFSILTDKNEKCKVVYTAVLSKTSIDETFKTSFFEDGEWTRLNTFIQCDLEDESSIFKPSSRKSELLGSEQIVFDKLRVAKILCAKEHRSFIFSDDFAKALKVKKEENKSVALISALRAFGRWNLFVLLNRNSGLISLDAALPVNFRTENSTGLFALPIDSSQVVPVKVYDIVDKVIETINIVLQKIIPGMRLSLHTFGKELMEDSSEGVRVQLVRDYVTTDGKVDSSIPLKYESEGIKKIISFLHLFVAAYNHPSITVAIDEMDSGIYEYLLGELLHIMQESGQGQLVFTSHDLYPLERLNSNSIVFTTTNPHNRYTKLTNIKSTNNLRLRYLREIALGSDDDQKALYSETNSSEIAHAMRMAGSIQRKVEAQ